MTPEQDLSDKDLYSLIFAPGFSTAKQVTNVSGRGVGMDVVKKTIDALRGSIDVQSEKGIGTTITLKIPLTLAIIEGAPRQDREGPVRHALICGGGVCGVIPGGYQKGPWEGTLPMYGGTSSLTSASGRSSVSMEGLPDVEQIVITEIDRSRMGFVVDNVIGQHQTVIKTLGRPTGMWKAYQGQPS